MSEKLWMVGQIKKQTIDGTIWEMQGIFDNPALADKACKNQFYFVGPLNLNEEIPDYTITWPEIYFPKEND